MKKKLGALLFVLISMFVLVGWGKKEVRLLDSDRLIDLSKAIEFSKPGGNAGDTEEPQEEVSETLPENVTVEDEKESEGENLENHETIGDVTKNIEIRIRGEKIFYNCGSVNRDGIADKYLEDRIRLDFVSGTQVKLEDDFAEVHTYKNVQKVLKKLKNEIGLTYIEGPYVGGE